MATLVTIDGYVYKKRSPFGAWLLIFPTLGIYFFVWYYKVYKEAKNFLGDEKIHPGLMVLSLFIPIWNYYTVYKLGEHVGRMEEKAGLQTTVQPILGLIAAIVAGLHIVYYQSELNKVWDTAARMPMAPSGPTELPTPPPPPLP